MNWLDRAIGFVAPRSALRRASARLALRAYDGAAVGLRTEGWITPATSADTEIAMGLPRLRDRSRDLIRNNPHAKKAVNVWTNNLVGSGIIPRAKSGNETLDKAANELWETWSKQADAQGNNSNVPGLMDLAVRTMVSGGEALIRRRPRRAEDGLAVPLQLQVMEGDFLDHNKTGPTIGGRRAKNGVEFDAIGRRSAYWLFKDHPGDSSASFAGGNGSAPIPASEIVHLYRKERDQMRGEPWASPVIRRFRDLDDYDVAEIVRKKTEACIVGVVLGGEEGEGDGVASPLAQNPDGLAVKDSKGRVIERIQPGMFAYSHSGKKIEFNTPQSDGGYPGYTNVSLHAVSAGYLLPYELMTGDLAAVNFSSSRVGLVEFRRLATAIQWLIIIPIALDPIWRWFCEAAWLAGKLPVPYVPVEWAPEAFESVNPIDDANADLIRLRSGIMTLKQAIAKTGFDPDAILNEHAETFALLDKLALTFDSDPRKTARGGNEQPSQQSQPDPPKPKQTNLRPVK